MKYWLFKTDAQTFSWEDLKKSKNKTTHWEGVRNYQARNFLKSMKAKDLVLFYHSMVDPLAIYGICEVVKEAYPDVFQFDSSSKYFDPKSSPENLRWWMVDVQLKEEFTPPINREELKDQPGLAEMELLKRGSRLSIQPVTEQEFKIILKMRPKK